MKRLFIFLSFLLNKIINLIIQIFLFFVLIIGFYGVYDSYQIYDSVKLDKELENVINDENDTIDFKQLNNNVIGWIKIDDTSINYPILKGKNNKEYINRNYNYKYSSAGSIFIDYRNNNFKDDFTIIYGHNLKVGGMFSDIKKYKDKEYFNKHLVGNIYINDKKYNLNVFAFAKINAYDELYYLNKSKNNYNKQVINFIKNKSIHFINNYNSNKLVLLSTCSDAHSNNRIVLLCCIK